MKLLLAQQRASTEAFRRSLLPFIEDFVDFCPLRSHNLDSSPYRSCISRTSGNSGVKPMLPFVNVRCMLAGFSDADLH